MLILPIAFDLICLFFPNLNSYKGSWWFFLFFSIIMYYIAITGYSNQVVAKIPFRISVFDKQPVLLLTENKNQFTEEVIDVDHELFEENLSPELNIWKQKIENLLLDDKLYQNPELTLNHLAQKLETNAAVISKTINQGFHQNFNDFINQYRIEEVKKAFDFGEHKKSTLLGIAFDAGFNSKATFNRSFKKNTGFSPKEYIENLST